MQIILENRKGGNMGTKAGNSGMQGNGKTGKEIKTFLGLDVYQDTLKAAKIILFTIIPKLPRSEQFNLVDQMRRASKAIPTLIAEGYAKKYQQRGYVKYLTDAMAESNEMIVHLSFAKEYLKLEHKTIDELISVYDIARKQIYKLKKNWDSLDKRIK